jgi:trimeric autotransporter adhesin
VIRKAIVAIVTALACWRPVTAQDPAQNLQVPPAGACTVAGVVSAQGTRLPGAVISLLAADGHAVDVSSSGIDGSFTLKAPAGQYTLTSQLTAFARVERDVTIDAATCTQRADVAMTLASRAAAATASPVPAPAPAAVAGARAGRGFAGGGVAGRGGRGQAAQTPQQFQSLELVADQAGLARSDENAAATDAAAQVLLPPGFSAETSAESVTAVGTASQAQTFFGGPNGAGDFAQRFGDGFAPEAAQANGGAGGRGFGGPGGGGRGLGGGGGFAGRGGRGNNNQIRGNVSQNFDTSAFDTAPYALNGTTTKPNYLQQRFTGTVGGPLVIPKIVDSPRTFFFLNYTGNHSRNPFDQYSTVPTSAERIGDLSELGKTIVDPRTGRTFTGNQIPSTRLDPSAQALLSLIPLPNQPGGTENFHTVTTSTSQLDDVNLRLVRTFGAQPQRGRGGAGGRGGRGGGGRAGGSNLNVTVHFRHSDNSLPNAFPSLAGDTSQTAWDTPVGYSFTRQGLFHQVRFDVNRQHSETTNAFANSLNVAGNAGVRGIASDPFDWGGPNLSFTTFAGLRDTNPSARTDQTMSFGDTVLKSKGRHTIRFGGDYRDIRADSRTDANARGSFVFSGAYSGLDFADFLLGLPQQATVQFGPGLERFRSNSWDLFVQDDWRATDKVTVNAGLRYEYYSPVSEASDRLVTLDAPSTFTAAVPVMAGATGPFSGAFSDAIVNPFRAGFAPRIGVAWRPKAGLVIRPGYSINYNASVYQSIAQQLAGQPPFAVTNTAIGTLASPLLLSTALANVAPNTVNNTYGVDPNYRLGFVQIWSLDVQKDVTRTVQAGVAYTGTKGANLDFLRAPNRGPGGLLIAGVAPFIWESSGADSLMNSISFRLRKRLTSGFSAGGTYTLSKATDDASSIGGGAGTVAQNDLDLAAERGLSNFDQRHRVAGDFTFELPFGANKPWLKDGAAAELFGNWVLNGSVQAASGTPLTARVLGAASDVARGLNGTLRANYNGAPVAIADPTTTLFFNTSAFSVPPDGTFGTAGRNTIIGPGTSVVNLSLTRNVSVGATRGLSIQIQANNVFNTVQFAAIDTIVNSRTFGQVTGVRAMRRIQVTTRFRF